MAKQEPVRKVIVRMGRKAQEPDMSTVGGRIRAARNAHGFTMEGLAAKIGVSKGLISQWEQNDIKDLKASNLFRLSDALHANARWLLYGKETDGTDIPMGKPRHLTADEGQLLDTFKQLPKSARDELLDDAQKYLRLTASHKKPSKANPYPKGPPKPAKHHP